jgi:hypothetical protein
MFFSREFSGHRRNLSLVESSLEDASSGNGSTCFSVEYSPVEKRATPKVGSVLNCISRSFFSSGFLVTNGSTCFSVENELEVSSVSRGALDVLPWLTAMIPSGVLFSTKDRSGLEHPLAGHFDLDPSEQLGRFFLKTGLSPFSHIFLLLGHLHFVFFTLLSSVGVPPIYPSVVKGFSTLNKFISGVATSMVAIGLEHLLAGHLGLEPSNKVIGFS